jgi:RNA polymerase sigma-70 factor, ECF subfamily
MHDPAETELLDRARRGEAAALDELLARHQALIYRFGMQMCRDPEDAKDVLQETLLAMARGIRDFRGASSLSTWLYTIARSFCIKKRRRRALEPNRHCALDGDAAAAVEAVPDSAKTPDEALSSARVTRALDEAIAALPPLYREALVLRDVEGLTAPEVAEVLGVSERAVKSRLHRARLAVRAHVAPLLDIRDTARAASPAEGGTCPDVLALFSKHLEGEIGADVCFAMERHLEGCDRCRGACDSFKRTLALCRAVPHAAVPAHVQRSVRAALRSHLAQPA